LATNTATEILFWVVVRDRKTNEILSAKNFKTHKEAVLYDPPPEERNPGGRETEVSIEILSAGRAPK
jgi:hypothetical protein